MKLGQVKLLWIKFSSLIDIATALQKKKSTEVKKNAEPEFWDFRTWVIFSAFNFSERRCYFVSVRIKGRVSLRNGMCHVVWKGIIMRNTILAE